MTTPLPALAEKRKPALNIVKIAKPFARCSTDLGITPSRPLFPVSTNDRTRMKVMSRIKLRPTAGVTDRSLQL